MGAFVSQLSTCSTTMTVPLNSEETPCYSRTADSVNNGTGKITLIEYRRQSTVDLSKRSVRTSSVEEFLSGLLPFRPGRDSRLQRPTLTTNPFKKLKNADSLVEAEVVELFVSVIVCIPVVGYSELNLDSPTAR